MLRLALENTYMGCCLQVIAEHKLWAKERDLCGRIYLSTQGINAQYSGLRADAEGYARWLETQDLFKVCKLIFQQGLKCTIQCYTCITGAKLSYGNGQC